MQIRSHFCCVLWLLLSSTGSAHAASYFDTDGKLLTIEYRPGAKIQGEYPYTGPVLQPPGILGPGVNLFFTPSPLNGANPDPAVLADANLSRANLQGANLAFTNLSGTDLGGADLSSGAAVTFLWGANLTGASLRSANLTGANLRNANLAGADLRGAALVGVQFLETAVGAPYYDASTAFQGSGFDPASAGWTLVPEPSSALLFGLGLILMPRARS